MEMYDTDSQIVQLGRHSNAHRSASSLFDTLIEKFFLVGGMASFIGGAIIGAHLWMMLNGQMKAAVAYTELRILHSLMQTYLFFGLFILGFLLQTAPRILRVPERAPPRALAFIPVLCIGLYLQLISPTQILGPIFIAFPFVATLLFILSLGARGAVVFRETYVWWVVLGLVGLSVSPFFPVKRADNAHLFVWAGVVPITFATGQQFLFAFLGGTRLSALNNRRLFGVYTISLFVMFTARGMGDDALWRIAAAMVFVSVVLYICWTRSVLAVKKLLRDPLALGFVTGYLWALTGTALIVVFGSAMLDASLHLLALGWFTTLIVAISSQVLRAIAGSFLLTPRTVSVLLTIWQLVPIGRGLATLLPFPPFFSQVVAAAMTVVLLPWLIALLLCALRIARKQLRRV